MDKQEISQTEFSKTNTSKDLLNFQITKENPLLITKKSKKANVTTRPQITRQGPSSVLDRVRSFLPQMAAAQEDLQKRLEESNGDDLNIENTDGCEKVIEMSLALVEEPDTSESEEEENVEEEEEDIDFGPVTEENIRLSKPKSRPSIEVVTGEQNLSLVSTQNDITT